MSDDRRPRRPWRSGRLKKEFMAHVRQEVVDLLKQPDPIDYETFRRFRGNSYERRLIHSKLSDEAYLQFLEDVMLPNSSFRELGKYQLAEHYDEALVGECIPELIKRVRRLLKSKDILDKAIRYASVERTLSSDDESAGSDSQGDGITRHQDRYDPGLHEGRGTQAADQQGVRSGGQTPESGQEKEGRSKKEICREIQLAWAGLDTEHINCQELFVQLQGYNLEHPVQHGWGSIKGVITTFLDCFMTGRKVSFSETLFSLRVFVDEVKYPLMRIQLLSECPEQAYTEQLRILVADPEQPSGYYGDRYSLRL